jgi:hypothetical protein
MIFQLLKNLYFILKLIFISIQTLPRDLKGFKLRRKIDKITQEWQEKSLTVAKQFRNNVKKHPNKAAIIFENVTWTFKDVRFRLSKKKILTIFFESS